MLFLLIICSLMSLDHFKSINGLNIKYNSHNVKIPNLLKRPSNQKLSMQNQINSELSNHPLHFENQIYSSSKYPYVGFKTPCIDNENCHLSAECNKSSNVFNRDLGIGVCTVRTPNTTAFNVSY